MFDRFADQSLNVAMRYIRDIDLANEAVIRGFTKAFKSIKKYTHFSDNGFKSWLMKIIANESLMLIRERKTIIYHESNEELDASIDSEVVDRASVDHINQAMGLLPEGYRLVLSMYAVEGFSHKEIADLLGIAESTSRSQLTYARKKLQILLSK